MTAAADGVPPLAPLAPDDPSLVALLAAAGLPADDLDGPGKQFHGWHDGGGRLAAAGGLEIRGGAGLLRSCVVAPQARGRGLGRALVDALERAARDARVARLFLLTETAAEFFARRGYTVVERSAVPPEIAGLGQFTDICPESATAMTKLLV